MTIFIPRQATWVHSARFVAESLGYVVYRWNKRVLVMRLVTNVVELRRQQ